MASLPLRLFGHVNGKFEVFNTRDHKVEKFSIITYTWGDKKQPYNCGIPGVNWNVKVSPQKLNDIKRLMIAANIQYLWVDCICLNQDDKNEIAAEIPRMYTYYKSAQKCYILMDMDVVWDPQEIVESLKFIDHVLENMGGASLASEAKLTETMTLRLSQWADPKQTTWCFPMEASVVKSTAVDMGVLNCYSTCISRVKSLFENAYFTRVWTFQEMLLGKNITMYGINPQRISCIGELETWMDLASDSKDKAFKLQTWIDESRLVKSASVNAILRFIDDDCIDLDFLQTQVRGISSARTDIIAGGPYWWHENYKGVSNLFSAISISPRECQERGDIFRGLLGVFSNLFTPEEVKNELMGDDMERISFAFFKQLSVKTGYAWTKLAISSRERGECEWIPVVENQGKVLTTDCFAGVVNLGVVRKGLAKSFAVTGITGSPRKYMKITPKEGNRNFQFIFKGCNCGKELKTGLFKTETIPTYDQSRQIVGDETGRVLVQCATILGSIIDPGCDVVEYRRRMLRKLKPDWETTDPSAKPMKWYDRCVSGGDWEKPDPLDFRVHNRSMNYSMDAIISCGSRLQNDSTANISCEIQVNCGCKIIGPFSLIFEALTAVEGSSLGGASASLDDDNRIVLRDGLGLVQVGDIGRAFNLVAFGGDIDAHKSYAQACKNTKLHKDVVPKLPWPKGRALVREEFTHGITDSMRDYGYVESGGAGNLLICQNRPMGQYKIVGVCIDEKIENKKGKHEVTIK